MYVEFYCLENCMLILYSILDFKDFIFEISKISDKSKN